eukprot:gene7162-14578_t
MNITLHLCHESLPNVNHTCSGPTLYFKNQEIRQQMPTLVSGYHNICSEIGRACWSELTKDSSAAQIDDICGSLIPLLLDYTSWKKDVGGDSALWYQFGNRIKDETRDFPFSPPDNNAIFIRGRAPFKDQGRSLTSHCSPIGLKNPTTAART